MAQKTSNKMSSVYYSARVKSVLSADTVILVPANHGGATAPVERQLSLAYVQAPKVSMNEAYSFQAREILRKLLLNKVVKFKVMYSLPGLGGTKREFGDIKTPIFGSLVEYLLEKGAVRVKETSDPLDEDYYYDLKDVEGKSRASRDGLWGAQSKLEVANELMFHDIEASKATPIGGIVEKVISGDRLLVRFLVSGAKHVVAPVLIAGIRAPRSASGPGSDAEPYGSESKYFVEQRLLLRDVQVSVVGESASGVLVGRILHPAGNIAEKILESGLAEVSDWQSALLGPEDMSLLRASERLSRVAQKGLWKGARAVKRASKDAFDVGASFSVVVARVVSADTLVVRTKDGDQERTVQLASLRAPRASDSAQAPFVPLAKEFVRKKTIGKTVAVVVAGVRPESEQFAERPLVAVALPDGSDLGEQIVRNGWAGVVRHRRGDDARSANWDTLIQAEKGAMDRKAGIHGKLPPAERIVDASETAGRAKTFLSGFSGRPKIPAVVDYVSAPNRFRLVLPKDGVRLVLVLGGLANKTKDAALTKAAVDLVTRKALQRDVHIEIYNVDKVGGFIGNLYLPGQSVPLQHSLLAQGFYEIHEYSVDQTKHAERFWDAQEEAQHNKIGIWAHYSPEAAVEDVTKAVAQTAVSPKYYDIEVNDISDEGLISFQILNEESDKLIPFQKEFHLFHNSQPIKSASTNAVSYPKDLERPPKKGDLVSAAYSRNGKYYRAKVLNYDKTTRKYKVQHIDFGNIDYVTSDAFRQLPPQFSLSKLPAQGHVGSFSLIRLPPTAPTNYLDDAVDFLDELILEKKIIALENKPNPEPGIDMSFTLYDPEKVAKDPSYSVNRELVQNGWAIVNKKLSPWEQALKKEHEQLLKLEQTAKAARRGCWEHGDIEEDD